MPKKDDKRRKTVEDRKGPKGSVEEALKRKNREAKEPPPEWGRD